MNKFPIRYHFEDRDFDAIVELIQVDANDSFYRVTTAGVILDLVPKVNPDTAEVCWRERSADQEEPREASISDLVQVIGEVIYEKAL